MNAIHVLGGRLRILYLVLLRQPRIAVAVGASLGKVQLEDRRIGILYRQYVVRAMAIPATGRAGGAQSVADPVNAGGVVFSGLAVALPVFMAGQAVWRRQLARMYQILDAGVAINAIELCMN